MDEKYQFGNREYTPEDLQATSPEDLVKLRNDVAEALKQKPVEKFETQEAAVAATVKLLQRYDTKQRREREEADKRRKREEERPLAKCAEAKVVERPTRPMFRTIRKLCDHPGHGYRVRRWDAYKDGMTLLDTMETEGLTHLDVHYYVQHNLMELKEPTDAEFEAAMAAWCKKRGVENPLQAQEAAAKAREAKAEKAKAAKAEKAKAEKGTVVAEQAA